MRYIALVILVLCVSCIAASQDSQQGASIHDCYNDGTPSKPLSLAAWKGGAVSRLHLLDVLWSGKQPGVRETSDLHDSSNSTDEASSQCVRSQHAPLTLVTLASLDRLANAEAQCATWPGPLVLALYVAVPAPGQEELDRLWYQSDARASGIIEEARLNATAFFQRMEAWDAACALRLLLAYEYVDAALPFLASMIPLNALRNLAMLAADTPLVAAVDADFLISASAAHDILLQPGRGEELQHGCIQEGAVYVMPAFDMLSEEVTPHNLHLANTIARGTKQELHTHVRAGDVIYFGKRYTTLLQGSTNYSRWFSSSWPYPVRHSEQYEPWYIVDRFTNAPYDVRFRGYGFDKIAQFKHMAANGVVLRVHPSVFILHRPHPKSPAFQDFFGVVPDANGYRALEHRHDINLAAEAFYNEVGWKLYAGNYVPVVDEPYMRCLKLLPWWHERTPWAVQDPYQERQRLGGLSVLPGGWAHYPGHHGWPGVHGLFKGRGNGRAVRPAFVGGFSRDADVLEAWLQRHPGDLGAQFQLACVYSALEDHDRAFAVFVIVGDAFKSDSADAPEISDQHKALHCSIAYATAQELHHLFTHNRADSTALKGLYTASSAHVEQQQCFGAEGVCEQVSHEGAAAVDTDCQEFTSFIAAEVVRLYQAAHVACPLRAEPLYALSLWYSRVERDSVACYQYAAAAEQLPMPGPGVPDVDPLVYNIHILDQLCMCAWYAHEHVHGLRSCQELQRRLQHVLDEDLPWEDAQVLKHILARAKDNRELYESHAVASHKSM